MAMKMIKVKDFKFTLMILKINKINLEIEEQIDLSDEKDFYFIKCFVLKGIFVSLIKLF